MVYILQGGIRCLQFAGNDLITGSWDTTIMVRPNRFFGCDSAVVLAPVIMKIIFRSQT